MSPLMTVGIRWATVITVHEANCSRIVCWRSASVALSIDAVASSRTKIWLLFSKARAKQNNCLCPKLQLSPSSPTAPFIRAMMPKSANMTMHYHSRSMTSHLCRNNQIRDRYAKWARDGYDGKSPAASNPPFIRTSYCSLHFSRACSKQTNWSEHQTSIWVSFRIDKTKLVHTWTSLLSRSLIVLNILDTWKGGQNGVRGVCYFTSHIEGSECWQNGSKLKRMGPLNKVGSWEMMLSFDLRSWSPIVEMSRSSMRTCPSLGSTRRNSTLIKVLFPLPVRPTMPTFWPPSILQVIPRSTRGASGWYRSCWTLHWNA